MPIVTAVTTQRRHPDRVSVFVDGEFAFGLDALTAIDRGVRDGAELTAIEIEELRALDDAAKATNAALRLLALRPRGTNELRQRLRQKGYDSSTIDTALERLEGWNYVNDQAFARFWVDNRESFKPRGKRLLEQELRAKGVDRETIREAIDEAEIDEQTAAIELARTKLRIYGNLDPETARRRLAGFLGRRGYGWDVIKPALDTVLGEPED